MTQLISLEVVYYSSACKTYKLGSVHGQEGCTNHDVLTLKVYMDVTTDELDLHGTVWVNIYNKKQ